MKPLVIAINHPGDCGLRPCELRALVKEHGLKITRGAHGRELVSYAAVEAVLAGRPVVEPATVDSIMDKHFARRAG